MRLIKGESKVEIESTCGITSASVMLHAVKGSYKEEVGKDASTKTVVHVELVKGDSSDQTDDKFQRTAGGLILKKSKGDISLESSKGITMVSALCKIKAGGDVVVEAKDHISLTGSGGAVFMSGSLVSLIGKKIKHDGGSIESKGSVIVEN
jgi:uncharacterized protein (DUF2345 family)